MNDSVLNLCEQQLTYLLGGDANAEKVHGVLSHHGTVKSLAWLPHHSFISFLRTQSAQWGLQTNETIVHNVCPSSLHC